MNSPAKRPPLSPIDHAIFHSLRRQAEAQFPRLEVKQQLMQRAAEQSLLRRLAAVLTGEEPDDYFGQPLNFDITFGWRELAQVQALRPSGAFGALSGILR
jgi:hypothetical protein